MSKAKPIAIGDKVCYSKMFCQSTGQCTGSTPAARGIVTALEPLGQSTLAVIDWGKWASEVPSRVNTFNLRTIKQMQVEV
jgi:hypothetical protein